MSIIFYLSFRDQLLDFLNSQDGKQPFKGDCRNNEDVDNCLCLVEIEERQLKALLSRLLSVTYSGPLGSCFTAATFRASGSMQLNDEPTCTKKEKNEAYHMKSLMSSKNMR